MKIAIPSEAPGGLEAAISEHFGHCASFTMVSVDDGEIGEVTVIENGGHEQGGCMAPVMVLKEHEVDALVAGGMGARPLSGFQQVGIAVHFKEGAGSVGEAVQLFLDGGCPEFGAAQTCGGGEGHCGSHHEVERPPIEGPADIRDGRVVTLDYVLKDADGTVIENTSGSGPVRYLHGSGGLMPVLEKACAGLEADAHVVVEVAAVDGFGERDDRRIVEVPRSNLPPTILVGAIVTGEGPQGQRMPFTVIELGDETARLDGNHPLAGKDLIFELDIRKVEAATPEELTHGHVH